MDIVQQGDAEAGIAGVLLLVGDGVEVGAELEEKRKLKTYQMVREMSLKRSVSLGTYQTVVVSCYKLLVKTKTP